MSSFVSEVLRIFERERYNVAIVTPLVGDASLKQFFRVQTQYGSAIVMSVEQLNDPQLLYRVEHLTQVYTAAGVRVPQCLNVDPHTQRVVFEDCSDKTFLHNLWEWEDQNSQKKQLKKILESLLLLHTYSLKARASIKIQAQFDVPKLSFEWHFAMQHLSRFQNVIWTEEEQACSKAFCAMLCEDLQKGVFVLNHRDLHSRNIMVKQEELVWIDFQDSRWGLPQYDLTSLLGDCYFEWDAATEQESVQWMWEHMKSMLSVSRDEWQIQYVKASIQRTLKAIGSFVSFYNTQHTTRYLPYVGRAFERLRTLLESDCLHRQNDEALQGIKQLFAKAYHGLTFERQHLCKP